MSKNICIFSDGTGNNAAKAHKTNVWKMYNALDKTKDSQCAYYDDGVGNSGNKYLRLLGGVCGWGLKRNVIEAYVWLCKVYTPGDKIYLFGFSRGAFTVRMLAGMISHCGLYQDFSDADELESAAHRHFRMYRSRHKAGYLTKPFRSLLRRWLPIPDVVNVVPSIEFVGVWDTVDAYGFPIDSWATAWDKLVFPLKFVDNTLGKNVKKAVHALAIDDERKSFLPLMWDEKDDGKRIEQVWFAGAHSDVGGGYVRGELANVSLDWMMKKVEANSRRKTGLVFIPGIRTTIAAQADIGGDIHNPRAGVGMLTRFQPRNIQALTEEAHGVKPKFHVSVMNRLRDTSSGYKPLNFPFDYGVVGGTVTKESETEIHLRKIRMKDAYALVQSKKNIYFWMMVTLGAFAISPWYFEWQASSLSAMWSQSSGFNIESYLPGFLQPWIEMSREHPIWALFAGNMALCWWALGWKNDEDMKRVKRVVWKGVKNENK